MLKWLYNKFWNEHTPPCMTCGWNMKVGKILCFIWNGNVLGYLVVGVPSKILMVSYIGGKINLKKMKKRLDLYSILCVY